MNTHPCPRTLPQGTGGRETLASITASWRIGSAASPRSVGSPARKGNCSASPVAMMPERITLAAALLHRDQRDWTLRALLALAALISVGGNAALGVISSVRRRSAARRPKLCSIGTRVRQPVKVRSNPDCDVASIREIRIATSVRSPPSLRVAW